MVVEISTLWVSQCPRGAPLLLSDGRVSVCTDLRRPVPCCVLLPSTQTVDACHTCLRSIWPRSTETHTDLLWTCRWPTSHHCVCKPLHRAHMLKQKPQNGVFTAVYLNHFWGFKGKTQIDRNVITYEQIEVSPRCVCFQCKDKYFHKCKN